MPRRAHFSPFTSRDVGGALGEVTNVTNRRLHDVVGTEHALDPCRFRDRFDDYEGPAMLLLSRIDFAARTPPHLALYKIDRSSTLPASCPASATHRSRQSPADTGDSMSDDF